MVRGILSRCSLNRRRRKALAEQGVLGMSERAVRSNHPINNLAD
jgi:hypothetical protein